MSTYLLPLHQMPNPSIYPSFFHALVWKVAGRGVGMYRVWSSCDMCLLPAPGPSVRRLLCSRCQGRGHPPGGSSGRRAPPRSRPAFSDQAACRTSKQALAGEPGCRAVQLLQGIRLQQPRGVRRGWGPVEHVLMALLRKRQLRRLGSLQRAVAMLRPPQRVGWGWTAGMKGLEVPQAALGRSAGAPGAPRRSAPRVLQSLLRHRPRTRVAHSAHGQKRGPQGRDLKIPPARTSLPAILMSWRLSQPAVGMALLYPMGEGQVQTRGGSRGVCRRRSSRQRIRSPHLLLFRGSPRAAVSAQRAGVLRQAHGRGRLGA